MGRKISRMQQPYALRAYDPALSQERFRGPPFRLDLHTGHNRSSHTRFSYSCGTDKLADTFYRLLLLCNYSQSAHTRLCMEDATPPIPSLLALIAGFSQKAFSNATNQNLSLLASFFDVGVFIPSYSERDRVFYCRNMDSLLLRVVYFGGNGHTYGHLVCSRDGKDL